MFSSLFDAPCCLPLLSRIFFQGMVNTALFFATKQKALDADAADDDDDDEDDDEDDDDDSEMNSDEDDEVGPDETAQYVYLRCCHSTGPTLYDFPPSDLKQFSKKSKTVATVLIQTMMMTMCKTKRLSIALTALLRCRI